SATRNFLIPFLLLAETQFGEETAASFRKSGCKLVIAAKQIARSEIQVETLGKGIVEGNTQQPVGASLVITRAIGCDGPAVGGQFQIGRDMEVRRRGPGQIDKALVTRIAGQLQRRDIGRNADIAGLPSIVDARLQIL